MRRVTMACLLLVAGCGSDVDVALDASPVVPTMDAGITTMPVDDAGNATPDEDAGPVAEDAGPRVDAGPCPGGCEIDGACVDAGAANPEEPCLGCDPALAFDRWVPINTLPCDDGLFCTDGDRCLGGVCVGTLRDCDDGIECNGREGCDQRADACVTVEEGPCILDEMCDPVADRCVFECPTGCGIGRVCFAPGAPNPDDPCTLCDPARDPVGWSVNPGATCSDGNLCTEDDVCDAEGLCAGIAIDCDDGVVCNGVERCDPIDGECDAGETICEGGTCDVELDECVCPEGLTLCEGQCVDTTSDPLFCGDCDTACSTALPNSVSVCEDSMCATQCEEGFGDCTDAPGCETDLDVSAANCGRCGNACATGVRCVAGACNTGITAGSSTVAQRDGWEARCLSWSGDLCTRAQTRVLCATCATYVDCGDWHDITPHNSAAARAAPNWCWIATGNTGVARTATGGTSTSPRACGWNSRSHPLCNASQATIDEDGSAGVLSGGLLTNETYCSAGRNLLHIECTGW
jgi:hypothetical protein